MNEVITDTTTVEIGGRTYSASDLSISDLCVQYFIGRGIKAEKQTPQSYYSGIMTPIGEIEKATWGALMKYLVQREREESIQEALFRWVKQECVWLRTDAERDFYALPLHAGRIYENKAWVGYTKFEKLYTQ